MATRNRLGESLLLAGLITERQLDEALRRGNTSGERIGEALVALGHLSGLDLHRVLAQDAGIPFIETAGLVVDPTVLSLVPSAFARSRGVIPLRLDDRGLHVAMRDPFDMTGVRLLERVTNRRIRIATGDPVAIARLIETHYQGGDVAADPAGPPAGRRETVRTPQEAPGQFPARALPGAATAPGRFGGPARGGGDGLDTAGGLGGGTVDEGATAAELTTQIIARGVSLGATDIHVEPLEEVVQIRYRIDGILQRGQVFPKTLQSALMSRIKILAALDIAESRLPQDGRVRTHVGGRAIDLRVSTFPTVHGEDVVLRILDRSRVMLHLDRLGIAPEDVALIRETLARPYGLFPVTGPTGSGKTTTLYSALVEMNTGDRCIITLEDPVEYEVEKIRQSQINVRAGLTFASGLRSILRHDPDVILVGEIRDQETVQIALSAALTGHLVLTTLHTTTAAGAIPRLLDMGAEPFIVASAITLIASQRLVRMLCQDCKKAFEMPAAVRERFGLSDTAVFSPGGCASCRGTGFRGRLGIFEFLPITPEIVSAIYDRRSSEEIRAMARRPTLLDDGLRKVRAGQTTLDEVLRVMA
jgi:type II secretory ATPase GspE/PulE/Tfp pilus assembly ATPase PilB-like protein